MSGHSKWSTIKRKKAATDAKRGNLFTRLAREISVAAREGGGDQDTNVALRLAVDRAKSNNMPKDNIERSIRRGTGEEKEGSKFEQIMYEGYAPHGVALMIEVVTDNRNRTVADLRHQLIKGGGNLADAGAVSWQFVRSAYFVIMAGSTDPEAIFEAMVEAGAEDVILGEEDIEIIAPVEAYKAISDALESMEVRADEASLRMIPTSVVSLPAGESLQVMRMIENMEDLDDVQGVFSNLDVTDEAVALLETA
ncbi:MAG: YebC/PmpR family DNA-binding transcriptional regulator [Chloroflexi bacterium]|nr:YebC/PmpR family DNA-binding transcriptional regulator [Chloroflexota bacterium]